MALRIRSAIRVLFVPLLVISAAAQTDERFGGIGITLAQLFDSSSPNHRGELVVLDVMEASPAAAAGIRGGDVITHVNGEATAGRDFEELVLEELRGPVGSEITLTVKRIGTGASRVLVIARTEIAHAPNG